MGCEGDSENEAESSEIEDSEIYYLRYSTPSESDEFVRDERQELPPQKK